MYFTSQQCNGIEDHGEIKNSKQNIWIKQNSGLSLWVLNLTFQIFNMSGQRRATNESYLKTCTY